MKEKSLQPRLLYPKVYHSDSKKKSQDLKINKSWENTAVQQIHQTSSSTNAKGSFLDKKHRKGL